MLSGIDPNQRIEFSSVADTSDPKTVFVFKPLSGSDMLRFAGLVEGDQMKFKGQQILEFLAACIVEVRNFEGATEVKEILDMLPVSVLTELMQKAGELNNITDKEAKNS